ncbi:hypothetical protein FRC04_003232 [Tulasnella sp. 424]|nr:hypothetical protein FRC04_003232 [Tulasnella sp. 424]KAG8966152.1 hypothetical protein FRC05_002776 [Tulasnella sp. 425]
MAFKPASISTIKSVSQCLLNSIKSENAPFLPAGLFDDSRSPWQFTSDLDLDELRACVSKTFDLLKQQLFDGFALTCRRRNSLLPIQRLPPEIFSASIAYTMAEIECHNHQQRLIQLSTVSWWWRQVTLGTPFLWGVISSKDPYWIVSLALERSKDAPLTVLNESSSYSSTLLGGNSYRSSIESGDFFGLVSPHTARWADATLPWLGSGSDSIKWLSQHSTHLSRHLLRLNLGWDGSPSTDNATTRFSGHTERLLDLKLQNLHVVPADIIRILAAARRMVSLDLDSLVTSVQQEQPSDENSDLPPSPIDLPCLKRLTLKGLPPSIMDPVVRNLNPLTLERASIVHNIAVEGDPTTHPDPLGSFTAGLIATRSWTQVRTISSGISLKPCSGTIRNFDVELQGDLAAVLAWLRLRSLAHVTRRGSLQLDISSETLGENPDQGVIENLMRLPEVGSIVLWGRAESWRWMWLLSLPDAVQVNSVALKYDDPIKSWLWPDLRYMHVEGDCIDEFTILSVLLARYGPRETGGGSTAKNGGAPGRLAKLQVRPGQKAWQAEVLDRIKELLGPGRFRWVIS